MKLILNTNTALAAFSAASVQAAEYASSIAYLVQSAMKKKNNVSAKLKLRLPFLAGLLLLVSLLLSPSVFAQGTHKKT